MCVCVCIYIYIYFCAAAIRVEPYGLAFLLYMMHVIGSNVVEKKLESRKSKSYIADLFLASLAEGA